MDDDGSSLLVLSASMLGVDISLPKQLMSLKPISSASMIMMFGFVLLLVVLIIVLEEENCQKMWVGVVQVSDGLLGCVVAPKII